MGKKLEFPWSPLVRPSPAARVHPTSSERVFAFIIAAAGAGVVALTWRSWGQSEVVIVFAAILLVMASRVRAH